MDRWEVLLMLAAGYVAVVTLVRLMAHRRNDLVRQVRAQIERERQRAASDDAYLEDDHNAA